MRNVIFDCDPGHDDIIAIMVALAHQEEFNILGFTTVAGNQTLEKVTNNLLKVQDYLGFHIPVSAGYDRPVCKPLDVQPQAHGDSGMDGPVIPEATSTPTGKHALEFIKETLEAASEPVTIIATGPLTNIGLFLKTYPGLKDKIDCIAIMGGGIYNGNVLTKAEFNIYHDPEGAKMVFDSGVKIIMAGLEVCYSGSILLTETELLNGKGKASQLVYDLMKFYQGYAIRHGWDRTAIFDMTPVVYLMRPDLFETKEYRVDIETEGTYCRGMTVVDTRGYVGEIENPKTVLISVQREPFIKIMMDSLEKLDQICQ